MINVINIKREYTANIGQMLIFGTCAKINRPTELESRVVLAELLSPFRCLFHPIYHWPTSFSQGV